MVPVQTSSAYLPNGTDVPNDVRTWLFYLDGGFARQVCIKPPVGFAHVSPVRAAKQNGIERPPPVSR